MKQFDEVMKAVVKPGSPQRRCVFTLAFFVLGLLFVFLGFWKTLLVAALTVVGAFIGASENLGEAIKKMINKLFPPAKKAVSYTAEEIEKVKKALSKKDDAAQGVAADVDAKAGEVQEKAEDVKDKAAQVVEEVTTAAEKAKPKTTKPASKSKKTTAEG